MSGGAVGAVEVEVSGKSRYKLKFGDHKQEYQAFFSKKSAGLGDLRDESCHQLEAFLEKRLPGVRGGGSRRGGS